MTVETRPVHAYDNEDGDIYVPIADEPDQDSAAQRYADQTGLLVVGEGRVTIRTQDCECVPTSDRCPDDDQGRPCVVNDRNECWWFTTFEHTDLGWRDLRADVGDEEHQVWIPTPRAVAPTSGVGGTDA